LVEERRSRPALVANKMWPRMGRTERVETARPATLRPRERFSWRHATFIDHHFIGVVDKTRPCRASPALTPIRTASLTPAGPQVVRLPTRLGRQGSRHPATRDRGWPPGYNLRPKGASILLTPAPPPVGTADQASIPPASSPAFRSRRPRYGPFSWSPRQPLWSRPGDAAEPRRGRGRVKELKDADVPDAGRLLLGIRVSQRPDPAVMQRLSVK
jgi:hypothetical protein